MNDKKLRKLVTAVLFAALACIATLVIQLRISPNGGYVNLGDSIVLLCAWILSPAYGMAAAGIGSMLADMISGYFYYAPATLVVKALMALAGGAVFRAVTKRARAHILAGCILSAAVAECIMAGGYYVFEAFVLGFGPVGALASMPGNGIQALCGAIAGTVVYLLLRRNKTLQQRLEEPEDL